MIRAFYILIVMLLISCLSCSDDDNSPDIDALRTNIVGQWEVIQTSQEIRADTVHAESSRELEITFEADGTGMRQSFLDTEVDFEWYYQFNPQKVVIIDKQNVVYLDNTQVYEVDKNETDSQIWEFEVEDFTQIADVFKHTWKMTKK